MFQFDTINIFITKRTIFLQQINKDDNFNRVKQIEDDYL